MSTILITGASGFIGSALARAFAAKGWRVVGAGRTRPPSLPDGVEWRSYDLAWLQLPPDLFDGIDAIVHGAVIRCDFETNVTGGTLLLNEAQRRGIKRVTFLSSLAAHDGALSEYGRQKFQLERLYGQRGALVIRPGLVLGNGGAFAAMCEYLRHNRFVPLIDGGLQPLQTVFIGDLADAVCAAVEADARGAFTVAEAEPVTYRAFYSELGARLGAKVTFVPVPFWAIDLAMRAAARLSVRFPIDQDNLSGLRVMRADSGDRLEAPGSAVGTFAYNLARAIGEPARHSARPSTAVDR